ncbi:hypothetical protein L211DRAFT_787352 [Terfezia boudieri ATCC MYA-4762]|uniref:C3H1-type domain-containing protein n=1 Tax=Terfezia boudieri ATCC MYA-4762 TaxID=1051890 RepID=A0A3N4LJW5_9PEZI|nr:hypothetical protein L211DRAFT_787352 [Terfezia boudieri ATCC MYA-4762]
MSERPSTASTSGRGTPPPNENKRVVAANSSPRPKLKTDIQTGCRNIVIYGYCRYQDKGCTFNHDTDSRKQQQTTSASERRKLNVDSPTFTPASTKSTLTSKTADAAPFTPSKSAGWSFVLFVDKGHECADLRSSCHSPA